MKIKSIRQVKKLTGKKVLLRADFNVPVADGQVKDDYRITAVLPTIRFLLRYRCRIIIIAHLGRPGGKKQAEYSLRPVAGRLGELLGREVKFIDDCIGFKAGNKVSGLQEKDILVLENLRFEAGEEKNDKKFARQLAAYGDIYVNEAFANSHRKHASMAAIKNYLPAFAGFLLQDEVENLNRIRQPRAPLVVILGGLKVATKAALLKKFCGRAFKILLGGVLANNFLAARKMEVGQSVVDRKSIALAKKFKDSNIVLPLDVVVSEKKSGGRKAALRPVSGVKERDVIFDIGPETIGLYAGYIKKAQTIIWNGPMGKFEEDSFRYGTLSVARVIAARSRGRAFGAVGGGETIEALKMTKMMEQVDWVSTGGGAMISYLAGEKMPGLRGIVR